MLNVFVSEGVTGLSDSTVSKTAFTVWAEGESECGRLAPNEAFVFGGELSLGSVDPRLLGLAVNEAPVDKGEEDTSLLEAGLCGALAVCRKLVLESLETELCRLSDEVCGGALVDEDETGVCGCAFDVMELDGEIELSFFEAEFSL